MLARRLLTIVTLTLAAFGMMMWLAPVTNDKTYTHVAVVTDGMGWPGSSVKWRVDSDTLWIFLR